MGFDIFKIEKLGGFQSGQMGLTVIMDITISKMGLIGNIGSIEISYISPITIRCFKLRRFESSPTHLEITLLSISYLGS